ncbi:hypothetical protein FZW96_14605 [Bacillus sp. BGMRC 2118]|nr:hypothetical protein FZW96_14605 [Bacillus sp. BGMRC 2118]
MTLMIRIGLAFKHLEEYKNLPPDADQKARFAVRSRTTGKIKSLIKLGLINGDANEVDMESLKEYLAYESTIIENYMSLKEFAAVLGIKITDDNMRGLRKSLNKLGSDSPFECIELGFPINLQTHFISKSSVESFLKDYISLEELKSRYDFTPSIRFQKLKKFSIHPLFLASNKQFVTNSEFETLVNELESKTVIDKRELNSDERALNSSHSDYYTIEESIQILSIKSPRHFYMILREYNIDSKLRSANRWKYFKKEDIDRLKTLQSQLREKYISTKECQEIAIDNGLSFQSSYIKGEPIASLLRPIFTGDEGNKLRLMYLKEDFNNWLEERKKSLHLELEMESGFETFKYRLGIKEIDINKLGPFTSQTWLQYVASNLNRTKGNRKTKENYINQLMYSTVDLINLVSSTKKQEIYSVSSNDINTLFNEIAVYHSRIIYLYLKEVYYQLKNEKIEAFNFHYINNPYKFDQESRDKSIYEYEEYKKVYNYTKDISLHKKRTIIDTLQEINTGGKGKSKYLASSWLYVLLHLNNAWRHSDVVTFPRVNLSGTQITDLNWMLGNELSDEDADYIVKQVYRSEFIISKTRVKNYFFCSEELKKPFATAIAICELRTNALFPLSKSLIDFGNKDEDFSKTRRKWFFKLYEDKEFHFSSRKMNRSLMTYIYVILSKITKGTAGLKAVQKMRGHLEQETTNIYVDIPEKELNFLTRQLFARGSFGFVYDTFLDVLQGIEIDREKRTTEIQFLTNHFGDINKIEEITGFLNVIQSDRKAILDRILSMGLEEALEFVNKIETQQLPSKQDNVQCMVVESGCVKKGKGISCFDCAFAIPNYYALSAIGASLQDRLNSYLDYQEPETEELYYEQRKKARLFYIQLDLFSQAIQRFGFDAYEFISDSREEFITHLDKIGSLRELYQLS